MRGFHVLCAITSEFNVEFQFFIAYRQNTKGFFNCKLRRPINTGIYKVNERTFTDINNISTTTDYIDNVSTADINICYLTHADSHLYMTLA